LEEGLGWGVTVAVHPEDLPHVMDDWRKAVASGERFEREARFRRADGEYRWFLVRAVPLRDELGSIVKWYGTVSISKTGNRWNRFEPRRHVKRVCALT
jgi:PAS domain-containing protein